MQEIPILMPGQRDIEIGWLHRLLFAAQGILQGIGLGYPGRKPACRPGHFSQTAPANSANLLPPLTRQETHMKANIGGIDRIVRAVVGLVLIGLTLTGKIGVWGWIGVVPLLTAIISFCPAYTIFGISTCPAGKKEAS
jgi:hypothetical protein